MSPYSDPEKKAEYMRQWREKQKEKQAQQEREQLEILNRLAKENRQKEPQVPEPHFDTPKPQYQPPQQEISIGQIVQQKLKEGHALSSRIVTRQWL